MGRTNLKFLYAIIRKLLESEIFKLTSNYGIKTIDELDRLIAKGKLTEKIVGEDFFILDQLIDDKEKLENLRIS